MSNLWLQPSGGVNLFLFLSTWAAKWQLSNPGRYEPMKKHACKLRSPTKPSRQTSGPHSLTGRIQKSGCCHPHPPFHFHFVSFFLLFCKCKWNEVDGKQVVWNVWILQPGGHSGQGVDDNSASSLSGCIAWLCLTLNPLPDPYLLWHDPDLLWCDPDLSETRKWRLSMEIQGQPPVPRSFHAAVSVGSRVVVLGGRSTENQSLADIHVFDTGSNATAFPTFSVGPFSWGNVPAQGHSLGYGSDMPIITDFLIFFNGF